MCAGVALICMNHPIRYGIVFDLPMKSCSKVCLSPTHSPVMAIDIGRPCMVQNDPKSF